MADFYTQGNYYGGGGSDIAGQQSLVKDTVGWTGKNLIPLPYEFGTSQTQGGITAKVNTDGSITFNGTVTSSVSFRLKGRSVNDNNYFLVKPGRYIFSCNNIENNFYWGIATTKNNSYVAILDGIHESTIGLTITSDMSDEAVDGAIPLALYANFRTLGDVYNDFTIYPMLRRADITDPTYEPYHESVEVMYEEEIHGVNLIDGTHYVSQTSNGVTWTVNSDGTIKANGTATGANSQIGLIFSFNKTFNAIFSGCPTGGSTSVSHIYDIFIWDNTANERAKKWDGVTPTSSDYGNTDQEVKIVAGRSYTMFLRVINDRTVSNIVFKPMLRKADIEDSTYRPYNPQAIQNQLNAQGVLGAKNLLPYPYADQAGTISGITYTYDEDGVVTVNGTATAESWRTLEQYEFPNLKVGANYILSGCPKGGATNLYFLQLTYDNGTKYIIDKGDGVRFTNPGNLTRIQIVIKNGYVANNLIFKPMITLASDPLSDYEHYVPYTMTNRELTEYNKGFNFLKFLFNADGSDIYSGNLNDLHAGYTYYSNTATNIPSNYYGYCITLERPSTYNYAVQIAITATDDSVGMYVRKKASNTWGAWKAVTMS